MSCLIIVLGLLFAPSTALIPLHSHQHWKHLPFKVLKLANNETSRAAVFLPGLTGSNLTYTLNNARNFSSGCPVNQA